MGTERGYHLRDDSFLPFLPYLCFQHVNQLICQNALFLSELPSRLLGLRKAVESTAALLLQFL